MRLSESGDTGTQGNSVLLSERTPIRIEGVIKPKWREVVIETHGNTERINQINYKICFLQYLPEKLCCKEIWVEGADKYRNSDEGASVTLLDQCVLSFIQVPQVHCPMRLLANCDVVNRSEPNSHIPESVAGSYRVFFLLQLCR